MNLVASSLQQRKLYFLVNCLPAILFSRFFHFLSLVSFQNFGKNKFFVAHVDVFLSTSNRIALSLRICEFNFQEKYNIYFNLHCKRRNQCCSSTEGRCSTANSGTKTAVLPKSRSSTTNSGTKAAILAGINKCGIFPFVSVPHSLFRI